MIQLISMKPQDFVFIIIFLALLYKRNPQYFSIAGLLLLFVSIPLFAKWIFFTAERFTWYAALCLLTAAFLLLKPIKKVS